MMQPLIVSHTDYSGESNCLHELCHGEPYLLPAARSVAEAPSPMRMINAIIERATRYAPPQSALQKVIAVEEVICR